MDFHSLLKEAIKDEAEGIVRYEKLAAMAPSEYAPILHDIEKEERQHLEFLSEIASKTGHMDDEESESPSQSEELTSSFEKQFEQIHETMNEIRQLIVEVLVAVKVASLHTNGNGDSNAETPEIENEENKPSMDTEKTPPPNGTAVENTAMPQSVSAQPTR